jgi:uncharacterized protein (TIGR00730 family)
MNPTNPPSNRQSVAVFGSSQPSPESVEYALASEVGSALAIAGYRVVTGGYGGVMEGASRGAQESGGATLGVLTELFSDRNPNRYLSEQLQSPDLYERTRGLIDACDAYVVLPGQTGTLAELAWVWALRRAGCLPLRPVIVLGESWRLLIEMLRHQGVMDSNAVEMTACIDQVSELIPVLAERLRPSAQ